MKKIKNYLSWLFRILIPSKRLRHLIRVLFIEAGIIKHKKYGRIYFPVYNMGSIDSRKPNIYNANGQRMDLFFLRDANIAHVPYTLSKYFEWDRYNFGLDTHFYTNLYMLETIGKPDKRYGLLLESEIIEPYTYKIFDKHPGLEKDFDIVFTYSAKILEKISNARYFNAAGSPWYGVIDGVLDDDAYKQKTKDISFLASDKQMCELHRYRIELGKKLKRNGLADTYGRFDGGRYVRITEPYKDYRYNVCIQNAINSPLGFDDKITNCFASMTVPVYLGAAEIGKFFNPDGIITFTMKDDIEKVLKQCTPQDYEARLPAVIDNYNRVKKDWLNCYDWLWENYFMNEDDMK